MTLADKINAALDANKTITVATYMRVVNVKAKHRAEWAAVGFDYFKSDSKGATLMIIGQKNRKPFYACIDFARVTAA